MVVLLVGLIGSRWVRAQVVPALSLVALAAALGLTIWQWNEQKSIVAGALRIDDLSLVLNLMLIAGGAFAVLLAWRSLAASEAAHGEFHALLLTSVAGMSLLAAAQNTVILFVGLELLSIPLYVLCAAEMRREHSLESGLKYLIIGSVGSATLLYGLAMIYGATGATDFSAIASALSSTQPAERSADADGDRADASRDCASRRRWRRSTSGPPTSTRARPRRSPPSWRWPPRSPRWASSCASSTSR